MATPTTIYVKDAAADEWRIISGFTSWAKCRIPVTGQPYRNTGWTPGTADIASSKAINISNAPIGATANDVLGTYSAAYEATVASILHATLPDEMAGAPQRQWLRLESATVFAFNSETLPAVGTSVAFTAFDTGTEIITAASHGLSTGDIVQLASGTIGGVSSTLFYSILKLSANTFSLLDISGSTVNLTGATGAGIFTLQSSASLLNGKFIFVLDSNNPAFSIEDPR